MLASRRAAGKHRATLELAVGTEAKRLELRRGEMLAITLPADATSEEAQRLALQLRHLGVDLPCSVAILRAGTELTVVAPGDPLLERSSNEQSHD